MPKSTKLSLKSEVLAVNHLMTNDMAWRASTTGEQKAICRDHLHDMVSCKYQR